MLLAVKKPAFKSVYTIKKYIYFAVSPQLVGIANAATSMTIQAITVGAVAFLGNDANAWKWMAIIYAIIGIVANTISVFSVKELPDDKTNEDVIKEEKKEKRNYSFKQAMKYLIQKSL